MWTEWYSAVPPWRHPYQLLGLRTSWNILTFFYCSIYIGRLNWEWVFEDGPCYNKRVCFFPPLGISHFFLIQKIMHMYHRQNLNRYTKEKKVQIILNPITQRWPALILLSIFLTVYFETSLYFANKVCNTYQFYII